jgi:hypothetical protein
MSLADELRKLQELRDAGTLTEAEFAKAKAALLAVPPAPASAPAPAPPRSAPRSDALGEAAQTWVNFQIVAGVIGFVIAAIFFFAFWLPGWNKMQQRHEQFDKDWNKSRQETDQFNKDWEKKRQEQEAEFRRRQFGER